MVDWKMSFRRETERTSQQTTIVMYGTNAPLGAKTCDEENRPFCPPLTNAA